MILDGPQTHNPYVGKTLGQLLFEAGIKYKNNIWQCEAKLNEYEDYATMKSKATRLAICLKNWGIVFTDVICIFSDSSYSVGVVLAAGLFIGAKMTTIDPSLSVNEIRILLGLVRPLFIFVDEHFVHKLETCIRDIDFTTTLVVIGLSNQYECLGDTFNPQAYEEEFRPVVVPTDSIALIVFSKTSGQPRPMCHTHAGFVHIINRIQHSGLDCNSVIYFNSLYRLSNLSLLFAVSMSGGCRVFCSNLKTDHIYHIIQEYRIRSIYICPYMTFKFTNYESGRKSTQSVRCIYIGGGTVSNKQIQRLRDTFPRASIVLSYELTELGPACYFHPDMYKHLTLLSLGACGHLAVGVSGKVVNIGGVVGPREKGEIRFKSQSLSVGYFDAEGPKLDSEGFFKTGDIGIFDREHCFYLEERRKQSFKYLDVTVVPAMLERLLLEHPAVAEAQVFGQPAPEVEMGELPTAWVVVKPGYTIAEDALVKYIADRVSDNEKLRGGVIFKREIQHPVSGQNVVDVMWPEHGAKPKKP